MKYIRKHYNSQVFDIKTTDFQLKDRDRCFGYDFFEISDDLDENLLFYNGENIVEAQGQERKDRLVNILTNHGEDVDQSTSLANLEILYNRLNA